jgi:DNA ligase 1
MQYTTLAELYSNLEKTPKRLEKTALMAAFLQSVPANELEHCTLLLQARVFPSWEKQTLGIASKVMLKTLSVTLGITEKKLEEEWKTIGDLGSVAEQHAHKHGQATLFRTALTTERVYQTLRKLASTSGSGSTTTKIKLLQELFSQATPLEARYLVRTVLEDLRVGVAEGTLRDAIVWAFFPSAAPATPGEEPANREEYKRIVQLTQDAYDRTNDFAQLAAFAKQGEAALTAVKLTSGMPVKVMLATREPSMELALARTGTPAQLEYKYDGFRVQIHKNDETVTVFTRRLENVTDAFPDIVRLVRTHVRENGIFDGEAIGVDPQTKKYVPFQQISQRIKRKHNIEELSEKLPLHVVLFDVMLLGKEDLLAKPHHERFERLQSAFTEQPGALTLPTYTVATTAEEAKKFFDEAKQAGCEGIMVKRSDSLYRPGARVGDWVKQKEVMEALDLVITGAEWGQGKRSGWLTSFELSCRNELDEFVTIGKVGTGLKEIAEQGLSFGELTELIKPHIEVEQGKLVKVHPAIVVEVAYEEIQASPSYTSGYALRFPRILRNRTEERGPDDASTLSYVEQLFTQQ